MLDSIIKFSGYMIDGCYSSAMSEGRFRRHVEGYGYQLQHFHTEIKCFEQEEHEELLEDNCDLAYCEQFFKKEPSAGEYERPIPQIGEVWQHFKTGKQVKILAVSQDTENLGYWSVVYWCPDGGIWNRPLDMFMSKTDKQKYPDATQEYRFVKVSHER